MSKNSADARPEVAVVHLLRRCNDISCFERFIGSYRVHLDPLNHELIIIFKGFSGDDDADALAVLNGIEFTRVDVGDRGFDLGPYIEVAQSAHHQYLCFFNSFSEILADEWLSKLYAALTSAENAGVVSASGSWETTDDMQQFPNYHVRTNAFMISRELFNNLETWEIHEKHDASLFEAGPKSLTAQILARGLEPYVVDAEGRVWAKEGWQSSQTYRTSEQERLMVRDNRTQAYQDADTHMRTYLNTLAWTDQDPGPNPAKRNKLSRRLRRWVGLSRA
ncbi:MAG: hypothetical protein OQK24_03135 [Magnetovibrio sp.]|nr:hypothetical protein [Magnetovibrio sp.]